MSVIVTAIRSQPLVYLQLLGVDYLLEALNYFMPQITAAVPVEGTINIDSEASIALVSEERDDLLFDTSAFDSEGIKSRSIYDVDDDKDPPLRNQSRSMSEDLPDFDKYAVSENSSQRLIAESDNTSSNCPLQLTNEQRAHLRRCLHTMIMILIQHGDSEKEVVPVIDFMATCRDNVVLNEVSDMLLLLVVEGDQKLISQIVSAFHGVEEYAAFMLFHLVHQPFEELR
eukprot:gene19076-19431_t